jgi:nucleoside-diphosphate-sugar epimerase
MREILLNAGASGEALDRLSFVAASLERDEGWADAIKGCTYVHHVASPFPLGLPKHEDELIIPAREGTLRVLRFSAEANVKRVILTSSSATVRHSHISQVAPLTEKDWTEIDGPAVTTAYTKSKTIAERAAWDFIAEHLKQGGSMELTVVIPVTVFGPILSTDFSPSIQIIKKLVDGSVPGCPHLYSCIVDVRDVASLHMLAMTRPEAAGERFLCAGSGPSKSILQMAKLIKKERPQYAKKVPSIQIPNFVVRILAMIDPPIRQIIPDLGHVYNVSNEKARTILGWQPRSIEASIIDTVDSLFRLKVV